MKLADKIIQLRKQYGWSQEELAEKLGVSRQSVSKWESAQSIPDLNRIIKLADIFCVSTDSLIKDDLETAEFIESDKKASTPEVSLEQALSYVNTKMDIAHSTVKGVGFCVCSPAPLIILLGIANSGQFNLSSNMAAALGICAILIMVAIGVSFFLRINRYKSEMAQVENGKFELSYGVHSVISEQLKNFEPTHNKKLSLGVAIFIGSVIPFLATAILSGRQDLTLLMLATMFLLIAAGLFIVVPASARFEAYNVLLNEGNEDCNKSESTKSAEKLAEFYWPLLLAIYLGWSLWTMNWGITWIIFPVGALAFAALLGLMRLLKKNSGQ